MTGERDGGCCQWLSVPDSGWQSAELEGERVDIPHRLAARGKVPPMVTGVGLSARQVRKIIYDAPQVCAVSSNNGRRPAGLPHCKEAGLHTVASDTVASDEPSVMLWVLLPIILTEE
jgi:hypothetical protein